MDIDLVFVEGIAATVASIIVFCGSIWLLLTMVLGGRLAYFVTASVTLGFLVIMGIVWSLPAQNPLGPVGKLPEWDPRALGPTPQAVDFGPASSYPEGEWFAADPEDEAELARAAELENGATEYLDQAITEGKIQGVASTDEVLIAEDSTLMIEDGGDLYGAVTFEPNEGIEAEEVFVVMSYDPGDPLGPARAITAGTFVVWVAHLWGLGRAERRARREREELGV